jgi:hypothetical protein
MPFRGIKRLLEDIRNPEASKERRKDKIDTVPTLPKFKGFKVPFIVEAAKEVAKVLVDLGPEGSETPASDRFIPYFDKTVQQGPLLPDGTFRSGGTQRSTTEVPSIEVRPEQEITRMPGSGDNMLDELVAAGISEMEILQIANGIEKQVAAMSPAERRQRARAIQAQSFGEQFSQLNLVPGEKKERKVSAYSKEFGKQLKKLKKLHPRTKIQNLMKKAHRRTRAIRKKK